MSTATEIPSNEEYTRSGSNPFRIAEGKIRRGREAEGTLETRDYITGKLLYVFIKEGVGDDGRDYQYVAARMVNREDGEFTIHASTSSKTAAGTFCSALCLADEGSILAIEPNLGKAKPGMSAPTYSNVRVQTPSGWSELRPEFTPLEDALLEFRGLPFYKERTDEEVSAEPYGHFAAYVVKRGWTSPESHADYSAAWMVVANKVFKAAKAPEITDWSELTEGHLARLTEQLDKLKECPKTVAEVDPFEDKPADPLADL